MMRISIPHKEVVKVQRMIEKKAMLYENEVKNIVEVGVRDIEGDAKKNIMGHVSAGRMNQSSFASGVQAERSTDGLSAAVYHRDFYAPYVEFGTGSKVFISEGETFRFNSADKQYASQFRRGPGRNATARPFLFPAFYKNRNKIVDKLKKLGI